MCLQTSNKLETDTGFIRRAAASTRDTSTSGRRQVCEDLCSTRVPQPVEMGLLLVLILDFRFGPGGDFNLGKSALIFKDRRRFFFSCFTPAEY